uniref:CPCC family cysteine-rich protein n=1 Tax=Corallococcus coralloides TaxID=184914 RepID=UPI0013E8D685
MQLRVAGVRAQRVLVGGQRRVQLTARGEGRRPGFEVRHAAPCSAGAGRAHPSGETGSEETESANRPGPARCRDRSDTGSSKVESGHCCACWRRSVEGELEPRATCPCCLRRSLPEPGAFSVCPVCLWENTGSREPERYSGRPIRSANSRADALTAPGLEVPGGAGRVTRSGRARAPPGSA